MPPTSPAGGRIVRRAQGFGKSFRAAVGDRYELFTSACDAASRFASRAQRRPQLRQ
jgi:hypothetical protein